MSKTFTDERGLIGVIELGLVGVLLVVLVFTGTRVYNATRQANQDHADSVKVAESSSPDFSKETQLTEEKDEAKTDDKDEEDKPASKPAVETTDKPKTYEKNEDDKEEPSYIELDFEGMEATGDAFVFGAAFGGNKSGYCKLKLYKGENYLYRESDDFSSQSSCSVSLPKDEVEESGEWHGYVKLYSSDGKLVGYTNEFEVSLTP